MSDRCMILFAGGQSTYVKGQSVPDICHAMWDHLHSACAENALYLSTENYGENGLAIFPRQVVAVVAVLD